LFFFVKSDLVSDNVWKFMWNGNIEVIQVS